MPFSDNYGVHLKDLHDKVITHTEFLKATNNHDQYKKWCKDHNLKPQEDNAELYFDMHGFEETEIEKEYMEPVY